MASKETRYTEEQIIRIVKEVESGATVAAVCRQYGVSEQMSTVGVANTAASKRANYNASGHWKQKTAA